ncbi:alpha/beta hydrolase [soil metagenome]
MSWGRSTAALTATFAMLLSLTGCGKQGQDQTGPEEPTATALEWGPCDDWVDTTDLPTAECTTVPVPVNWSDASNPEASQAELAVLRVPATGEKIGTLISNPGGPGVSAVEVMSRFAPVLQDTEMGERFDLVAFDPRGVGFSTPEFRCLTDAELDEDRRDPEVDYSPAGVQRIEDLSRQYGQRCLDAMGADFIASMGTDTTAQDMDAVRAALGEEQINYLGYSYGTRLGTAYSEQFPDRVRAMMLDGVVDQNIDTLSEELIDSAGFQQAFDAYAADCGLSPDCPLGTDPAAFNARFRELVDPLVEQPAVTADPRGLSYKDAMTAVDEALYSSDDWETLTKGLAALADGSDPGDLLELADRYHGRDADGHYTIQEDGFIAVHCIDGVYSDDPAVWAESNRQARELAPYESYKSFTGHAPRPMCVFWPVESAPAAKPPVSPGPGKVVVVSTTGDPATPYQVGVGLAERIDAPLITYDGEQHTVAFSGEQCVDDPLVAFFVDRVQPPAELRC